MALVGTDGTEFVKRLCEALGVSYDQCGRIIIDIKATGRSLILIGPPFWTRKANG
jgi:hypothetical protein